MPKPVVIAKTVFKDFNEVLSVISVLHSSRVGYVLNDSKFTNAVQLTMTDVAYREASKLLPNIFPLTKGRFSGYGVTLEWRLEDEGSMEWRLQHKAPDAVAWAKEQAEYIGLKMDGLAASQVAASDAAKSLVALSQACLVHQTDNDET